MASTEALHLVDAISFMRDIVGEESTAVIRVVFLPENNLDMIDKVLVRVSRTITTYPRLICEIFTQRIE